MGTKVGGWETRQEIIAIIQARDDGGVDKGENKGEDRLH